MSTSFIKKPTPGEILIYRAEHQCGLYEAKRELYAKAVKQAILDASTLGELQHVLVEMFDLGRD